MSRGRSSSAATGVPSNPSQMSLKEKLQDLKDCVDAGLMSQEEADSYRRGLIEPRGEVTDGDGDGLKDYFRSAELRKQQPWRKDYDHYCTIKEDWAQMSLETLQEIFVDNAKAHLLQPTEAMLSIYLLYGGEKEIDFLRRLLVNSKGSMRMMMHNLYVAEHREESFLKMWGDKIVALGEPLFPHTKEFTALNNMILQEGGAVGGGGGERSLFKQGEEGDPLGGGPHAQFFVQHNQEGQAYVDLSNVEQAVDNIQRQILAVKNRAGGSRPWWTGKGKGKGNGSNNYYQNQFQPPHQQQYQQQQQYYPNPQYNNNNNNNNGRGNPAGAGEPQQASPASSQPPTTTRRN